MKRILVLQLTRLGDVLQTTPLLSTLRQRHPHARITLVVRPMGKPAAERIPCVDELIVYDEDSLFGDLRAGDSDRMLAAFNKIDAFVQRLRAGRHDAAYNCTHSIASAMLLRLAQIPRVIGAHMSDDWQFLVRRAWPNYFFTSALHRAHNDLNLCDLNARFVDDVVPARTLTFAVNDADRAAASRLLAAHGIDPAQRPIAVQLGASDVYKRWPPEKFAAAVLPLVAETAAPVVLLGVDAEASLGAAFEAVAPRVATHLYGKTTVPLAAAILERSQLLLTNDTGTQHLAAAVRCPVVLVSVGYVHFRETGPYAAGNVAVEGIQHGHLGDDGAIQPEHVAAAASYVLHGELPMASASWDNVGMYASTFAPDGCLAWYPLIRRTATSADIVRQAYRMMWLHELDAAWTAERERAAFNAWRGHFHGSDHAHIQETQREAMELAGIAGRGMALVPRLLDAIDSRNIAAASAITAGLSGIDREIRIFGAMHEVLRPITAIAGYERDNLENAPAVVLAQESLARYKRVHARAQRLSVKLDLLRPAAAHAPNSGYSSSSKSSSSAASSSRM